MSDDSTILAQRIWESDLLDSREEFSLISHESGYRLSGTTLILHDGVRVEITYAVEAGRDWSTRAASVSIPALAVEFDVTVPHRGRWVIDGDHRAELDGCVDIDLGWTPATNTLPIRRLPADKRTPTKIRAAWLKWPKLVFIPADQVYTAHDDGSWTYASGTFSAELMVDEHGVVVTYGQPPIWRAVALDDAPVDGGA